MSEAPCQRVSPDELRTFDLFKDDDEAALTWLSERFEVVCYDAGEAVFQQNAPAEWLAFILDGEVEIARPSNPTFGTIRYVKGEATGLLPFSRMKVFKGQGCAVTFTRLARMQAAHLRELVYRAPHLAEKLISLMTDRTRDFTQMAERNSKMLALGKLSAGLAHELNNPASAVLRSSKMLREMLFERRQNALGLRGQFVPEEVSNAMEQLLEVTKAAADSADDLDDLERSDLEADLSDWLESHGLTSDKASAMICAGLTPDHIKPLEKSFEPATLDRILNLMLADHRMLTLIAEIEDAARRMAQLVQDVKSYSYMDTSPADSVDVEEGIRATMRMFQHQLRHGYTIKKDFAGLPKIHANGNELNQIWTNLIDNAIDAMDGLPDNQKSLTVRTAVEPRSVLVEITDSGKGIPQDLQGRIFEPFFTTKGVGKGTGLGLDIVQRIVRNHNGTIDLESEPGRTTFSIRLPK